VIAISLGSDLSAGRQVPTFTSQIVRALVLATRHVAKVKPFECPSELEHAPLEPNVGRTSTVLLAKRTTHAVVIRTHFDPDEAAFTRDLQSSKDGKSSPAPRITPAWPSAICSTMGPRRPERVPSDLA
jgi:hypothetical protein